MRKNSKSLRKSSPKKGLIKKQSLKKNIKSQIGPVNIQSSLYRKYSISQNYFYANLLNSFSIKEDSMNSTQASDTEQCLQKYHKSISRKHAFPKIKEVYKMHKQIPKIFQKGVNQILNKCYHRKRLLDYFKIAKILGLKVQSIKFSTFLLSLNEITYKNIQNAKQYVPIIPKISYFDFSQEIQKKLLQEIKGKENIQDTSNC